MSNYDGSSVAIKSRAEVHSLLGAPPEPQPKGTKVVSALDRLGWYGLCCIVVGTILILTSIVFISFLWFSDSSNETWHRIILADWTTRSIALTALVIRSAVTAHALTATAMLAALALQWHQVPLGSSASFSLLRFTNSGPYSLLWLFSSGRSRFHFFLAFLVAALTLMITLVGATSTALLSDVVLGMVPGSQQDIGLYFGVNMSRERFGSSDLSDNFQTFWTRRPEHYPSFAEFTAVPPVSIDGLHDTGVVLRAFLPTLSEDIRSTVRNFSGVASVVGMRTVCARPLFSRLNITDTGLGYMFSGYARLDIAAEEQDSFTEPGEWYPFDCLATALGERGAELTEWTVSICHMGGLFTEERIDKIPVNGSTFSSNYLLINTTSSASLNAADLNSEWTIVQNNTSTVSFGVSACGAVYRHRNTKIHASRPENVTEPRLSWDLTKETFDTEDIRRQLGAKLDPGSVYERGLLSLDDYSISDFYPSDADGLYLLWHVAYASWTGSVYSSSSDSSLALCRYCTHGGDSYAEQSQAVILNQILQDTGHPALAVQAFSTIVWELAYLDNLVEFDVSAPTSVTLFALALRPEVSWGYYAVISVLGLHLALMAIITLLFLTSAKQSILGNAWSSVAQLKTAETEWVLDHADLVPDKTVRTWFETSEKASIPVGLSQEGPTSKIHMQGFRA